MNEGSKVAYVGDDTMVGVGTLGCVLSAAGNYQHVQWLGGSKSGEIDMVPTEDLVQHRIASSVNPSDEFADALDTPALVSVAVRETYDNLGEDGLLTALDEAGHLATLSGYADEALAAVASRLRQDRAFATVLGQLDEFEAESLLVRVAVSLLSSADEES